jgi:hypothetical protein
VFNVSKELLNNLLKCLTLELKGLFVNNANLYKLRIMYNLIQNSSKMKLDKQMRKNSNRLKIK